MEKKSKPPLARRPHYLLLASVTFCYASQAQALELDVMTAKSFVAGWAGDSCMTLTSEMKTKRLGKSEFESSKEYLARFKTAWTGRALAFKENKAPISTGYDADKNIYTVSAFSFHYNSRRAKANPAIFASENEVQSSVYPARNAFGAATNVTKTINTVCAITFANLTLDQVDKFGWQHVRMNVERAKVAKGNIGIYYVGTLLPPYFEKYEEYDRAELTSPYDRAWTGDSLVMALRQVVVFNVTTGEIYKRTAIK